MKSTDDEGDGVDGAGDGGWRPMPGGTMARVERSGDVVRRSTGPWTPAVHAVLRHLEAAGFPHAPRVLGVDRQGRELLTHLAGETRRPDRWEGDDRATVAAGRMLRALHDALVTFPVGEVGGWDGFLQDPDHAETVCHNDFGVYNCLFVGGLPAAMVDFDSVAPGGRAWDLAATALSFVPLNPYAPPADAPRRLALLCDAYGWAGGPRLVAAIHRRVSVVRDRLRAAVGTALPQARGAEEGVVLHEMFLRLLETQGARLEAALR
jgi:hypothetical protein